MIRKFIKQLLSMPVMGLLVVVLAVAMAAATFIENSFGTIASKALVYNAWWFEVLIGLTFINILWNIFKFRLYKLNKISLFLFHLSFLIIILGAGVTRYVSSEGTMHIREGESSSTFDSYDTYFYAAIQNGEDRSDVRQKAFLSPRTGNEVNTSLKSPDHKIRFKSSEYISGRQMAAQMGNMGGGVPDDVLKMQVRINGHSEEILLRGRAQQPIRLAEYEVNGVHFVAGFGSMASDLPFSIKLVEFQLERYPGSNSPSSYASEVMLIDKEQNIEMPYRIFMNHILKHRGYRFYQSSYDPDEKGTVLSVNNDALGTGITYLGYFLMIVTLLLALVTPGSRFVKLVKETRRSAAAITIMVLLFFGASAQAQTPEKVSANFKEEARAFGQIWVQGVDGRFKPVNTLAQELTIKLFRENRYEGMLPEEFWLKLMMNPTEWELQPIFELASSEVAMMLGKTTTRVSFADFFRNNTYILSTNVNEAIKKTPNTRTALDKDLISVDEKLNVFYLAYTGQMLRLFPIPDHPESKWVDVTNNGAGMPEMDSVMVQNAFSQYLRALSDNNLANAALWREAIGKYQMKYSADILPPVSKSKLEILYNKLLVFERLAVFYAVLGLILLVIQFLAMFRKVNWHRKVSGVLTGLFIVGFVVHTFGLAVRWYVSGHAPMSNGYESMIFVAWGTLLAGILLIKRSRMAVALTVVLAALALLVAHLSWMSPEITPLVPVLKSPWLTIHVAVIMTSYSFLGLGALVGLVNLVLYITKNKKNAAYLDEQIAFLTKINKIVLIVGLYLITIGCFLGAIWANVSWGRYWGWDPKETWCLISILVYTFITHMHNIKGMEDDLSYNISSVIGFGSIVMTYFGVNYFLGGMHSYAGGASPTVPMGLYAAIVILIGLVYWAYFNQQRFLVRKES